MRFDSIFDEAIRRLEFPGPLCYIAQDFSLRGEDGESIFSPSRRTLAATYH